MPPHPISLQSLADLEFDGVSLSASVLDSQGRLGPVGGSYKKLQGAVPRIHTVVMAEAQREELLKMGLRPIDPEKRVLQDLGDRNFHVVLATQISEVPARLRDLRARHHIDCHLPPLDPLYVRRKSMVARIPEFTRDNDCGYLLLVGGAGTGKTSLVADLIRAQQERARHDSLDRQVVYHFIDYHPSATGRPDTVAACLYNRLRLKYRFREPDDWHQSRSQLTFAEKLEFLFKDLSPILVAENRQEVFYVDAADQSEAGRLPGSVLLPGALPNLPPGFFGVVTSRTDLRWLNAQLRECQWDEAETRQAVAIYLQRRQELTPDLGLTETLIQRIISHRSVPVFFTVKKNVDELANSDTTPERRRELLDEKNADLWVLHAEERVCEDAAWRVKEAAQEGIPEAEFWSALGLIALAAEKISLQTLRQLLGRPKTLRIEKVLNYAATFFKPRPRLRDPKWPYQFDHPEYWRVIYRHLEVDERDALQRKLAIGCRKAWENEAYARRNGARHFIHAGMWEDAVKLLMNWRYLEARAMAGEILSLFGEMLEATDNMPAGFCDKWKIERIVEAIGWNRDFLSRHPECLFQCMWNLCWWYDCPQAEFHYDERANDQETILPWKKEGPGLHEWMQTWLQEKASENRFFVWLRSLRPPRIPLGSSHKFSLVGHRNGIINTATTVHGKWMVSASSPDNCLQISNAETGEFVGRLPTGLDDIVVSVSITPDGTRVASGSCASGTVLVWDVDTGVVKRLNAGARTISGVSITADGKKIVSGSDDGFIRIWNAETAEPINAWLAGHGYPRDVSCVSITPDGERIVSAHGKETVRVWNGDTRQAICDLSLPHKSSVTSVSITPDGKRIVSGSADGTVQMWNAETGKPIGPSLTGHTGAVRCVSITLDGKRIVSGSDDNTIRIWHGETGMPIGAPLAGHSAPLLGVSVTPDGKRLLSVCKEGEMRVWNAEMGAIIGVRLIGHEDHVDNAKLTKEGKRFVTKTKPTYSQGGENWEWDMQSGRGWPGYSDLDEWETDERLRIYRPEHNSDGTRLETHRGRIIAWFPDVISNMFSYDGLGWGGFDDNHVYILRVTTGLPPDL